MKTTQVTKKPEHASMIVAGTIESAPSIYVDGLAHMTSGPLMSKLHFFQVSNIDRSDVSLIESRRVVQTLIIPTVVLAELATNVLKSMAQNRPNLLGGYDKNREVFVRLLEQVSIKESAEKS